MINNTDKGSIILTEKLGPEVEALTGQIKERARHLYLTQQLLCTEAVMVALNHGLNGGLSDTQAVAMAAPFSVALGESGCMCGALSGAVMASGLFLGNDRPYGHRREMRISARQLHDMFKEANGATCCRVLSEKVKHDKEAHFQQCAELTANAAEMVAWLVLKKRPELLSRANNGYLARRETKIGGTLSRLLHLFFH
jgi:C_GCAxxG_C_C family probable redox protein